ncbi:pilin [Vibrio stylophorae]|uniref:pilin n=1 Tax=Vibrio stylophorae TaxID=659351 RepID=UPI001F28335C|nr:hypothetical protein [Vibrio stylophorae]
MSKVAAIAVPQYSDYMDRGETGVALNQLEPLKQLVETQLLKGAALPQSLDKYSQLFSRFVLLPDGAIVVKIGRSGQVLVLIPKVEKDGVIWQCIGGSNKAVPPPCR